MKEFAVVGKRIPKTDAPDKVTGRATYGQDFKLPGIAAWRNSVFGSCSRPYSKY